MSGRFPARAQILDDSIATRRAAAYVRKDIMLGLLGSRQSYDLIWARAERCPCLANDQTEQPDPTCVSCSTYGNRPGWRYKHPRPDVFPEDCAADGAVDFRGGEAIRGLMTNMTMSQSYQVQGRVVEGGAQISTRPDQPMGLLDRFIMVDTLMPFDQVLVRQSGASRVTCGRDESVYLRYPIASVLSVSSQSTRYLWQYDWTVDPLTGELIWVTGRGPAAGARFAIRYQCHPRWVVVELPRVAVGHRFPGKEVGSRKFATYGGLPQRAMVRLDFLV